MNTLANKLNGFDFFFEYIDDYTQYSKWRNILNFLKNELKELTPTEKETLKTLLTEDSKNYFKL